MLRFVPFVANELDLREPFPGMSNLVRIEKSAANQVAATIECIEGRRIALAVSILRIAHRPSEERTSSLLNIETHQRKWPSLPVGE
jgi:hypothetical protein